MSGSPASVSAERPVLICGLNWVGDSIMSMPAVQAFRRLHPQIRLHLLVKPGMAPLWRMHDAPDRVDLLGPGLRGIRRAAADLKLLGCHRAYILPRSFRAGLAPWLARIPERIGPPGHGRDFMLTRAVRQEPRPGHVHQAYEYYELLAPEAEASTLENPRLTVTDADAEAAESLLAGEGDGTWIGLLPGAARGPSKQWAVAHFVALGRSLSRQFTHRIVVLGAPSERSLCERIREDIGTGAVNLAGQTSFGVWAGLLSRCRAVVANDSGGMHLAAALGTPVVALYGMTDPAVTGPLGPARILQKSTRRSRDIPRESAEAQAALASITPEEATEAVRDLVEENR